MFSSLLFLFSTFLAFVGSRSHWHLLPLLYIAVIRGQEDFDLVRPLVWQVVGVYKRLLPRIDLTDWQLTQRVL